MYEDELKAKKLGFLVICLSIGLIVISCVIISLLEDYTSLKVLKMRRYTEEIFDRELKNQEDKIEMYLILPEDFGREEIDKYLEELGNRFNYKLITIEFKYNHVIYKYRKFY